VSALAELAHDWLTCEAREATGQAISERAYLPWNGSWNEIVPPAGNAEADAPLIAGNAGDGGHDVPLNRPPEAGAQVRILPGAPRNSGVFAKAPLYTPLICPISGADFIARFIARRIVFESF
jgi:hypothetical protein